MVTDCCLFYYFSGPEEASISCGSQVHSASHMVENEPYLPEDNLRVMESLDAGAMLNNHADESGSSDPSKTDLDSTVVGRLL